MVPVHPELQTALTAVTNFGAVGEGRLIEVSRSAVWRWVQQAVLRAIEGGQIPEGRSVGTHTLRHSFARHMLLNGIPLNYLRRWLGCGRIQTTFVYLELAPDPWGSLASVPWLMPWGRSGRRISGVKRRPAWLATSTPAAFLPAGIICPHKSLRTTETDCADG